MNICTLSEHQYFACLVGVRVCLCEVRPLSYYSISHLLLHIYLIFLCEHVCAAFLECHSDSLFPHTPNTHMMEDSEMNTFGYNQTNFANESLSIFRTFRRFLSSDTKDITQILHTCILFCCCAFFCNLQEQHYE